MVSGLGVTVSNGATFTSSAANQYLEALYQQTSGLSAPFAFDFYGKNLQETSGDANPFVGVTPLSNVGGTGCLGSGLSVGYYGSGANTIYARSGCTVSASGIAAVPTTNVVWTSYVTSTSTSVYLNYASGITVSGTYVSAPFVGMGSNYVNGFYTNPVDYWIRIRAYPPGGVMPSATFMAGAP